LEILKTVSGINEIGDYNISGNKGRHIRGKIIKRRKGPDLHTGKTFGAG